MLVKLAVLGTLGYVGYRYLQSAQADKSDAPGQVSLAGGPLSSQARVQHSPDLLPDATPAADVTRSE